MGFFGGTGAVLVHVLCVRVATVSSVCACVTQHKLYQFMLSEDERGGAGHVPSAEETIEVPFSNVGQYSCKLFFELITLPMN